MAEPGRLDVDARFLLANERTLLAWVRTSLTLLAAGVGTLALVQDRWRTGPGIGLLAVGVAAALAGLLRYRSADLAIRRGVLPPAGQGPVLLAGAVAVLALSIIMLSVAVELG